MGGILAQSSAQRLRHKNWDTAFHECLMVKYGNYKKKILTEICIQCIFLGPGQLLQKQRAIASQNKNFEIGVSLFDFLHGIKRQQIFPPFLTERASCHLITLLELGYDLICHCLEQNPIFQMRFDHLVSFKPSLFICKVLYYPDSIIQR